MGNFTAAGSGRGKTEVFIDKIDEGAVGKVAAEVLADEVGRGIGAAGRLSTDVWCDDDVGEVPERAFDGKRLDFRYIEARAAQMAGLQGGHQVFFDDNRAAGDVD